MFRKSIRGNAEQMDDEPAWRVSQGAAIRQQDTVVSFEDLQVRFGHKSGERDDRLLSC